MWLRNRRGVGRADGRSRAASEIESGFGIERARQDVEASQLRRSDKVGVQLGRLRAAEIPAFSGRLVVRAAGCEQRTRVLHDIGDLVVTKQDRSAAASV